MKKLKYSDQELVRLILETTKKEYFEMLYDRYATFVYNKCFWFVHNEEEAKDLTQEIFIKIYLNLSKFKGNSKLSTWIYAITVNTCIEYARKKRNHPLMMSEEEFGSKRLELGFDSEMPSYSEVLEDNYSRLQKIMNEIPPEERALLLMKYQDNLPISKIVEVLNVTESAVKMRLLRAKQKIVALFTTAYL